MKKTDFLPLSAGEYALYKSFADPGQESCERSWANLLLYIDSYQWHYAVQKDRLWVTSFKKGYLFFPADGSIAPEELAVTLQDFQGLCCCEEPAVCGDVPLAYIRAYPQVVDFFSIEEDRGEFDYIYDLEHLAGFTGAKLRKRHNQLKQFERAYENHYQVRNIAFEDLPHIRRFAAGLSSEKWQSDSGLEEKLAFERLESVWREKSSGLNGIVLEVDGRTAGFSIYSPLNETLADIHFEKADRQYCGCGVKITRALVDDLLNRGFRRMNREQDLNIEGLRRAKQALDPEYFYRRFTLKLR